MAAEMERLAGVGVRKNQARKNPVTSNLVIARYDHDTSRELDPQLHTHLVAGNLTYDGAEQANGKRCTRLRSIRSASI